MTIPAALVKELRTRTGAGMMECKRALQEVNGNMEAAIELMRKSGQAKAAKKAGRIAAEGMIGLQSSTDNKTFVLVEVNCETDFVAKDEGFKNFTLAVANCLLDSSATTVETLLTSPISATEATTVQEALEALITKLGENIKVRRFERISSSTGNIFSYAHGTRIGVLVEINGGDETLGKDLAMHIAASNPAYLKQEDVPAAVIAKEQEIFTAQANAEAEAELQAMTAADKPQKAIDAFVSRKTMVIEKKVAGRVRKFINDISLSGQPFVKDPKVSISALLQQANATILQYRRLEVGEGIEKKKEDFAAEVAAQVQSAKS